LLACELIFIFPRAVLILVILPSVIVLDFVFYAFSIF